MNTSNLMDKHSKQALLVIDVQQGLFERKTRVYGENDLLTNINKLIKAARQYEIPVIFIQHENENTLVRDSSAWQLHPRIQPMEDEQVIHKQHGDAFQDTQLQQILDELELTDLLVTGLVSQGCVRATTLGAIRRGFRVQLVSDGHSTFSKGARDIISKINRELEKAGANLVLTGEATGQP